MKIFLVILFFVSGTFNTSCFADDKSSPQLKQFEIENPDFVNDVQVDNLRDFFVLGDKLITIKSGKDDKTSRIVITDVNTMEEITSFKGGRNVYLSVNTKDASIISSNYISEGRTSLDVFNLDGHLKFSKENIRGTLFSSPNSSFFYTTNAQSIGNEPEVFDSLGNSIQLKYETLNEWSAFAFNDSVLAVFQTNKILFFNALTGDLLKALEPVFPFVLSRKRKDHYFGGLIYARLNYSFDMMYVSWGSKEIVINKLLEIETINDLNEFHFQDASFSNDGNFLSVLYSSKKGSVLKIFDNVRKNEMAVYNYPYSMNYRSNRSSGIILNNSTLSCTHFRFEKGGNNQMNESRVIDVFKSDLKNNLLTKVQIDTNISKLILIEKMNKLIFYTTSKENPNVLQVKEWGF